MADDEDFGPLRQDVRDVNKLDTDDVPNDVLDKHLERAYNEVQSILKTGFDKDNTPTFTDVLFNTRDFYYGLQGYILYFNSFEDYNYIQSITAISYKTSDDDSFATLNEGIEKDYITDYRTKALKFTTRLVNDGFANLKVSGTYGYKNDDMPKWIKDLIAIIAAVQGIVYASGGSYQDVKTISIGNTSIAKGQYATNLNQQYKITKELLAQQLVSNGVKLESNSVDMF